MAQRLETLALFPGDSPLPRSEPHTRDCHKNKLWLAAHFPRFSLESLGTFPTDQAIVVTEIRNGHICIIAANDESIAVGIGLGLKLSAAYALNDELKVLARSVESERAKLEILAGYALQYTSVVSLEPPAALLMEVSGSLKLFGGIEAIKNSMASVFRQQQVTAHLCAAPTTLAALWLARMGEDDVLSHEKLVGRLSSVSVEVTEWSEKTQALLKGMGIRTLGDCMRLPRDGFARRVGRRYLQELDRARGGHDLRHEFELPLELSVHYELGNETTNVTLLTNIGKKLIARLVEDLRKRQVRVPYFECVFHHFGHAVTVERIHFSDPAQDEDRFVRLLADRLEQIRLAAPVIELSLKAGPAEPVMAGHEVLFGNRDGVEPESADSRLIERLRARFGTENLYGMTLVDEHRPEAAWAKSKQLLQCQRRPPLAVGQAPQRPLWLLPVPRRLSSTTDDLPCYKSREPLHIKHGPERIESGWWDGGEIGRDYYIASSVHGERLWIYKDHCPSRGWYLHGFFG